MDRLAKQLPIRSNRIRGPTIFVANMPTSHYKAFGSEYYQQYETALNKQPNTSGVHLLINAVNPSFTIEERAYHLTEKVKKIMDKHPDKKARAHLQAFSFAGIDARCALSLNGLNEYVRSLTTLCSPHHGMTLIDKSVGIEERFYVDITHSHRALEVLGVTLESVKEFGSRNMRAFNKVCEDKEDVMYFSFGAKRKQPQICELLRPNFPIITEHQIEVETDGLIRTPDTRWANYMVTLEHDHFEAGGLNPRVAVNHICNLMTDCGRVSEIRE